MAFVGFARVCFHVIHMSFDFGVLELVKPMVEKLQIAGHMSLELGDQWMKKTRGGHLCCPLWYHLDYRMALSSLMGELALEPVVGLVLEWVQVAATPNLILVCLDTRRFGEPTFNSLGLL